MTYLSLLEKIPVDPNTCILPIADHHAGSDLQQVVRLACRTEALDDFRTFAIKDDREGAAAALLDAQRFPALLELAALLEQIRGYGHVKLASVEKAKARERELLTTLWSSDSD